MRRRAAGAIAVLISGACFFTCAFGGRSFAASGRMSLEKRCARILHNLYPKAHPEKIKKAPVPGLCEVWYKTRRGEDVIYLDPSTGYLIFGEILTPAGVDLTQRSREQAAYERFKNLKLKEALKWGNGRIKVVLFTDPDCPFSARAEKFLFTKSMKNRLKVYVFLYPLTMLHPHAKEHAINVLCSENPVKTLLDYADHKEVRSFCRDGKARERAKRILKRMEEEGVRVGITGTPTMVIGDEVIVGADLNRILSAVVKAERSLKVSEAIERKEGEKQKLKRQKL